MRSMVTKRSLSLAAVTLVCCVPQLITALISCNVCNGSLNNSTASQACGTVDNSVNVTGSCTTCSIVIIPNVGFSRVCLPAVSNHTDGCEVTPSGSNNCYCNSDSCNRQAIYYGLGNRTCYVCTSVDFMDNGCGANLDTNSVYVLQQSGCTACGKTIAPSAGGGLYTRSCLNTPEPSGTGCTGSSACSFRCTSDRCNAAPPAVLRNSSLASFLFTLLWMTCARLL